jgi:predicted nucleic acid-binding Zn ribbon protein
MKRRTVLPSSKVGVSRLGDVLPQLIAKYGLQQKKNIEGMIQAWREVVGEPYASVTRVAGLKRGVLEIVVPHSAFVQELSFQQKEMLEKIQAALPEEKIKKIRFAVS